MGNADRLEPLLLVGPKGLTQVVDALRMIAPELPFEVVYKELQEPTEIFWVNGMKIRAFRVNHNISCYGYTIEIERAGRFMMEKAKSLGLPVQMWGRLQKGETIEFAGTIVEPNMVLGPPRKGLKVGYCTDTRPTKSMVEYMEGSDLLIIEGMYGEPEKAAKARQYKHMTFYEAAQVAKDANVGQMWLTHFSPSLVRPEQYMKDVTAIFEQSYLGKDGKTLELVFDEE